ncbi:CarD family transcriptional regulator [Candidatus Formimonas warabiya]|uniref:CarD family transcriptional regulator n=1 Tax=Formimonas warabiya TaxID=1761012 RepID=A0A3G1KUK4_FORW1|nr:CarD family transcriptional regulator [Candidatus Formimonas warabiya]ATW26158.1 CarD family transcriptional regulator [Candidatus Formimonas warabiya]
MFQIGDKIFYPMHGAGVIEAIEEKEILGYKQLYYVMSIKNMQVMFPMGSNIGIRQIVDLEILEDALTTFSHEASDPIQNPVQRYRCNMNKLKSGDIYKGAQVIRDLTQIGKKRALAAGDKNMLDNARRVLTSELGLVKGIDQEEADDFLNKVINN